MTDHTEKVVLFELRRDGEVLRRWYSIFDPDYQHYLGKDDDGEFIWVKRVDGGPNGEDPIIRFASQRKAASLLNDILVLREAGVTP